MSKTHCALRSCIPTLHFTLFQFFISTFLLTYIWFIIGLEITPHVDNGLVFYFGPMTYNPKLGIQDFMSLELQQGFAVLYVDYGTGTVRLDQKQIKLTDGKSHRIDVYWKKTVRILIVHTPFCSS